VTTDDQVTACNVLEACLNAIPDGFRPSQRSSGYLDLIGPIYEAGEGANYRIGLRVEERHANTKGYCHGGVLSAIADVYLGRIAALSMTKPCKFLTSHLSIDYLSAAPVGAWLEAVGQVDRIGRSLAHSSGRILADGTIAVRCAGVFQISASSPR
jgi:uncharacterized protein (TIGR00369 family)